MKRWLRRGTSDVSEGSADGPRRWRRLKVADATLTLGASHFHDGTIIDAFLDMLYQGGTNELDGLDLPANIQTFLLQGPSYLSFGSGCFGSGMDAAVVEALATFFKRHGVADKSMRFEDKFMVEADSRKQDWLLQTACKAEGPTCLFSRMEELNDGNCGCLSHGREPQKKKTTQYVGTSEVQRAVRGFVLGRRVSVNSLNRLFERVLQ